MSQFDPFAEPPAEAYDPDLDVATADEAALQDNPDTASLSDAIRNHTALSPAEQLDTDVVRRAKSSYATHGGNVAAVVRDTGLTPKQVNRLAAEHDWPVYGDPDSQTDKATRTRLRRTHERMEERMLDLLSSLDPESKGIDDLIQHGANSRYVANLSARSSAFKAAFDAWQKVGEMISPEVFSRGPQDHNGITQRQGGLAGIDRDLEDFLARVTVGMASEIAKRDRAAAVLDASRADYVDAEVLE